MKQFSIFIIEDEIPAQKLLKKWVDLMPEVILKGIYADGFSALKALQVNPPDLVLLDIELPKLNGIEILELLDNPPQIIFTTAYHEYAVKAFELNAVDYLLKPFSFQRFNQAVEKALQSFQSEKNKIQDALPNLKLAQQNTNSLERVVVKDGSEIFVIPLEEILYFEAQDDYVKIHTKERAYLKLAKLKFFEESLKKQEFVRVHRSFIVKLSAISKIGNYSKDSQQLILTNGDPIRVSRSGSALLKEILYS